MRRQVYPEVYAVRLPDGAKQELEKVAAAKYQSPNSLARQAIMAAIEQAREDGKNKVA